MLFVILLALVQQGFNPGDQFAVGVIRVHGHADTVVLGQQVSVLGSRYRTEDFGLETVGHAGAGEKRPTAVGQLDNDVGIRLGRGFHHRVQAVGAHHVDGRQGITAVLCGIDQSFVAFAGYDARLHSFVGHGMILV